MTGISEGARVGSRAVASRVITASRMNYQARWQTLVREALNKIGRWQ